jgi:hypothetical protein
MHFDLDKRLKEACEKMQHLIESYGDHETMNLVDLSQMYVLELFIQTIPEFLVFFLKTIV